MLRLRRLLVAATPLVFAIAAFATKLPKADAYGWW
jgi:hypothetical protein